MSFTWGTVTGTAPLRVKLDGDTAPVPITPDCLVAPDALWVGARVRCELSSRRLIVHGASQVAGIPSGTVAMTARTTAPAGWLLCQGQAVSRTDYPALFAALGTTYGAGDGSTTFNLPDMRGRVPVGVDGTQTEFATSGKTGGEKTHVLSVDEMPSHSHAIGGPIGGALSGAGGGGSGYTNGAGYAPWFGGGFSASPAIVYATGGSGAHNNLQPYIALNGIIKA